jgi:hypothetical protein
MELRFPLKDVIIEFVSARREVSEPLYRDEFFRLNQHEFSMDVPGVAWFYAAKGEYVSVLSSPDADISSVELYLNGSVYGAILHQRKIIPLHGSCFTYGGKGVMICGGTGVGKSSLTASFCLSGAEFLTDDVTPILVKDGEPLIWALSDRIKLWNDTLEQLEQSERGLHRVDPGWEKFYYPMDEAGGKTVRLDLIYILGIKSTGVIEFEELSGSSKFTALGGEIYRSEYLPGMPENEPVYFRNLVDISNRVRVFRVARPETIRVNELAEVIREWGTEHGAWGPG